LFLFLKRTPSHSGIQFVQKKIQFPTSGNKLKIVNSPYCSVNNNNNIDNNIKSKAISKLPVLKSNMQKPVQAKSFNSIEKQVKNCIFFN
jgi:hypothetical protein